MGATIQVQVCNTTYHPLYLVCHVTNVLTYQKACSVSDCDCFLFGDMHFTSIINFSLFVLSLFSLSLSPVSRLLEQRVMDTVVVAVHRGLVPAAQEG